MIEPDNTRGGTRPVGAGYNVLTGLLLAAALMLYLSASGPHGVDQTFYLYSATCLICAMLCRVVVAIQKLKK
jgi:hypothetical protein